MLLFTNPTCSTIFRTILTEFAIFAGVAVFGTGTFSASGVVGYFSC
jgi:hypothetical protein